MRLKRLILGLLAGGLMPGGLVGAPDEAPDKKVRGEDEYLRKAVERAREPVETERERWVRELARAYPDRAGPALATAGPDEWFDLLAGGGSLWQRQAAPRKSIAELFDRVASRLELPRDGGIRPDQFRVYASQYLHPDRPSPWKVNDPLKDIEKAYRSLDASRDGLLQSEEWSPGLRSLADRVDGNRDGVIDQTEYRVYFEQRVTWELRSLPPSPESKDRRGGAEEPRSREPQRAKDHPTEVLPGWFHELDTDEDGQVGLYEWRRAQRKIADFVAMDLNGDGYLPPSEYRRYLQRHPEAAPPPEPDKGKKRKDAEGSGR